MSVSPDKNDDVNVVGESPPPVSETTTTCGELDENVIPKEDEDMIEDDDPRIMQAVVYQSKGDVYAYRRAADGMLEVEGFMLKPNNFSVVKLSGAAGDDADVWDKYCRGIIVLPGVLPMMPGCRFRVIVLGGRIDKHTHQWELVCVPYLRAVSASKILDVQRQNAHSNPTVWLTLEQIQRDIKAMTDVQKQIADMVHRDLPGNITPARSL